MLRTVQPRGLRELLVMDAPESIADERAGGALGAGPAGTGSQVNGHDAADGRPARLPPLASGALPVIGHALEFLRDYGRLLERGYAEHGEIFRLRLGRRPAVFLLGPDLAKWVFKETDRTLLIGPSLEFTEDLFGPDLYYLADADEYQRQRAIGLPMFRGKMAAGHLAIMMRRCAQFTAGLGNEGTFDLPSEMNDLVLGVLMEALVGDDFARRMPPTVARDFRLFIRGVDPITPAWVPAPHLVRARRARDRLRAAAGELVRARRDSPVDPPDYLQVLASAQGLDGEPVDEGQVVREVLSTVFAGHDSTTGYLGWAVIDLLQHPDELAKVLAELQEVVPDGSTLDPAVVHRMACLDRALRETMRLHPVVPLMIRRAVRPVELRGRLIPEGAEVFIAPVLSHRLPQIFTDAESYRPDRYLTHPELAGYLHGFGGGGHRCLGEHFAELLAHVALTQLFQQFDLTLIDQHPAPVRTPAFKGPRSPCRIRYQRKP
jgi:sterol 14alpha-demethylase